MSASYSLVNASDFWAAYMICPECGYLGSLCGCLNDHAYCRAGHEWSRCPRCLDRVPGGPQARSHVCPGKIPGPVVHSGRRSV